MTPTPHTSIQEFREAVAGPDEEIDLARAALVIEKVEYPQLDIEPVLRSLDALASRVWARAGREDDPPRQVMALSSVVLEDLGMRGAEKNYYDPRNSFLNQVIERKVGIPVSISILYLSVGARAGIALGGTAMPMHFLVRVLGTKPPLFVDCYNKGKLLGEQECLEALRRLSKGRIEARGEMLEVIPNRVVLTRLMTNLKMIYFNTMKFDKALPILDRLLVLSPEESSLLRERGLVRYRLGQADLAREDLTGYLDGGEEPADARAIRKLLRRLG